MAEAPLSIILNMLAMLIESGIETVEKLFALFGKLLESLFLVSVFGGAFGIISASIILGLVLFFSLKFFFGSAKSVTKLIIVGILVVLVILVGYMLIL